MISSSSHAPLKIVFAGTPDFAAHYLQLLLGSEHDIVAVYTQPDRPAGRGKKLTPSPVKKLALRHNLPIEQPVSFKDKNAQQRLINYQADVMIVVAYGLLLPQVVLDIPVYGCLNIHASLLPRWRGAAPIQRAIEAGDKETGVTIMQMDKGLDTGDMLAKSCCDITSDETAATLHDKLMLLGESTLLAVLQQVQKNTLLPEMQNSADACYAEKITKEEAQINWQQPIEKIIQKILAFNPYPIAYSFYNEQRIKIHEAKLTTKIKEEHLAGEIISCEQDELLVACSDGVIAITKLQIPNKKAMTFKELKNGHADIFKKGNFFNKH